MLTSTYTSRTRVKKFEMEILNRKLCQLIFLKLKINIL